MEKLHEVVNEHKQTIHAYVGSLRATKANIQSLVRWNNHAFDKLGIPFDIYLDTSSKANISTTRTNLFQEIIQIAQSNNYDSLERIMGEVDVAGRNALHYACIIGDLEVTNRLLAKNTQLAFAYDAFGYLPIELALKYNNQLTASLIRHVCPTIEIGMQLNIIAMLIKHNNYSALKEFISHCNSTHLYYACLYNRPMLVQLLIENSIKPTYCKDFFFTKQNLLHLCAIDGDRVECLEILLNNALMDPKETDSNDWNPLDHAMYRFHRLTIDLLKPHFVDCPIREKMFQLGRKEVNKSLKPACFPYKSPWIRTFVDSMPQEIRWSKTINVMCVLAFKKPLQELLHLIDTDYFFISDTATDTVVEVSAIDNFSNFYYFCFEKRNIYHFRVKFNYETLDIYLSPSVVETGAYLMVFEKQDIIIEMVYHFIFINDSLRNQEPIEIPYPLVIGHRGGGEDIESIESNSQAMIAAENTIKSFSQMHSNFGNCCIEFDVQLTMDKIPVIYHDWLVPETGFDSVGLHSLRLDDLKKLKTKQRIIYDSKYEKHWGSVSKEEIPTLQEAFERIDEHVSFNIEIKFPHEEESNRFNLNDELPSINQYCDIILDCIAKNCQPKRKIILSSFHPEVTIALKFKQSKYPVFYLTECGENYTWDLRWQSIQQALRFSVQCSLDGIVCDSKIFYWSPVVMQKVVDSSPNVWTYGKYNKNEDHLQFQYRAGIKGLITDTFATALKVVNNTQ